jgi:uncharacterized membrane protein YgdD (TMEM256/DUF423 family)
MQGPFARLSPLARRCLAAGAILMMLGVMLGAFGAHALQARLEPRQLASYQTGVQYQMLHAFGLLIIGIVAQLTAATPRLRWSARLMLAGIAFFSGSIYLMTAGAPRWLGMVAPVGGVSFMVAWALLAWHALAAGLARDSGEGS